MPFVGFVVNRVHAGEARRRPRPRRATAKVRVEEPLQTRLLELWRDARSLASAEQRAIARLEVDTGESVVRVPELPADVHDLRGLMDVARSLLAP